MIEDKAVCDFVVKGKIHGKGRPRHTTAGHVYTDPTTREYERAIVRAYRDQSEVYFRNAVYMCIRIIFAVPKSVSKAERERMLNGIVKPQKRPDVDNVVKVVMDALNKVAYDDDKQVTKLCSCREYGEEEQVLVRIMEI